MPESPQQDELPLEAPPLPEGAPLLPARMVNEYVYCPRLAYLEWVQGEWKESADTVAGAHAHRRVDHEDCPLPPAAELREAAQLPTRSVTLSSSRLGLIAKIDLLDAPSASAAGSSEQWKVKDSGCNYPYPSAALLPSNGWGWSRCCMRPSIQVKITLSSWIWALRTRCTCGLKAWASPSSQLRAGPSSSEDWMLLRPCSNTARLGASTTPIMPGRATALGTRQVIDMMLVMNLERPLHVQNGATSGPFGQSARIRV